MSSLDPALFEPDRSEPTDHVAARPPLAFWSDVWRRFRQNVPAMASLVLGGALERHPDLRVAFLESGTGWLPYWLARLDGHAEWMHETETKDLSLTPSEYFARQCVICTDPDDPLAAWLPVLTFGPFAVVMFDAVHT